MGICMGWGDPEEIKRIYLVYDSQVLPSLDTSDGNVLSPCLILNEAKNEIRIYFPDGVVFSYLYDGDSIWDERFEWAFFMEDKESWQQMEREEEKEWMTCWIKKHPKEKELIKKTVEKLLSSK